MSNKIAKIERSTAKDMRQQPAPDKPSTGRKRKSVSKDWLVMERGSDEYIEQCKKRGSWMSWITEWTCRGRYESEPVAESAIEHFKSQTGDKYIFKVINERTK